MESQGLSEPEVRKRIICLHFQVWRSLLGLLLCAVSVLQPPWEIPQSHRNQKFKLFRKDQTGEPKKLRVLPFDQKVLDLPWCLVGCDICDGAQEALHRKPQVALETLCFQLPEGPNEP